MKGTSSQVAQECGRDARCVALIWKPLGVLASTGTAGTGVLRGSEGADRRRMVRNPATTIYYKEGASAAADTAPPDEGSSSLSAGAVAAIAVGAAAAAVTVAAGGWVLLRRRRQGPGGMAGSTGTVAKSDVLEDGNGTAQALLPPSNNCCAAAPCTTHRGVLGAPPAPGSLPASRSMPVAAAGAVPQRRPPVQRASSSDAGGVLVSAMIARPVAPSPFAAARLLRVASSGSSGASGSSAPPSSEPWTGLRPDHSCDSGGAGACPRAAGRAAAGKAGPLLGALCHSHANCQPGQHPEDAASLPTLLPHPRSALVAP